MRPANPAAPGNQGNTVNQQSLRVAVAQVPPISGSEGHDDVVELALARTERLAARAAAAGADVLVLPEMHLTGYAIGAEVVGALAVEADGAASSRVAASARAHGVAICHGFPERDGDAVYNAAAFVDEHGTELLRHRKMHRFGEVDVAQFSPSDAPPGVARWRGWGIGVAICYDIEFPEVGRMLAFAGADVVCVPTANMVGFDAVSRLLVPARAYENQMFVAYGNYCGSDAVFDYNGLSVVAGPDGEVLAEAGRDEELLLADLSREVLEASRVDNPYLHDRRGEIYG